jgi:DNA-binding transcriptional regulator GbsR (MarR family)
MRAALVDRTDNLTQRILAVCDAVGSFIEGWGFKSIHGRVWALLALSKRPIPQAEIAETLAVSRSLISLAVAELTQYGLVRPVNDSRNAPYEASLDVWPTITDVIRSREWMLIERARVTLESALAEAEYREETGLPNDWDLNRLKLLLAMTELAQTTLKAILGIRMPRSLDTFGQWLLRTRGTIEKLGEKLFKLF